MWIINTCLEAAHMRFLTQLLAIIKLHYQANTETRKRLQFENILSKFFRNYQERCNYPKKSAEEQITTLKKEL
jgi:hypothetical protein